MSFKEFLKESTMKYPWAEWKALGKYLEGQRLKTWNEAIDLFQQSIEKKEIYNVDYKDNYSYGLSRGLEKIIQKIKDEEKQTFLKGRTHQELSDTEKAVYDDVVWNTDYAINSLKKSMRTMEKHNKDFPVVYDMYKLLQPIYDMNKELKGYVVSGRKPTATSIANDKKKQQFSQAITREAAKKVVDYLEKAAADIKKSYEKYFYEHDLKMVEDTFADVLKQFEKMSDMEKRRWWSKLNIKNTQARMLLQNTLVLNAKEPVLEKDWKARVQKGAERSVKEILDGFIAKNTRKLAMIVDKKANLKSIKIIKNDIIQGVLNNEMIFEFEDGAGFKIYTQTIYKYSKYDKLFTQYPTRFTNVTNSDKSRMSAPNEEKMVKDFF